MTRFKISTQWIWHDYRNNQYGWSDVEHESIAQWQRIVESPDAPLIFGLYRLTRRVEQPR